LYSVNYMKKYIYKSSLLPTLFSIWWSQVTLIFWVWMMSSTHISSIMIMTMMIVILAPIMACRDNIHII
jgi:hypothetical protein